MTKTWGAWRYYSSGYLASNDSEIGDEIVSEILSKTGFRDVKEFNTVLSTYPRGELPEDLQARLKAIFQEPTYTAEDVPEALTISDGFVTTLEEPLVLPSPFRLAEGHEPLVIEIYAMSIEEEGAAYSVNLKAGISSPKLFEAASKELEGICGVLIDKLASGSSDDLDDDEREILRAWLVSNGANGEFVDDDLTEELGMQVRYIVESIGISTIPFPDEDGEEIEFWIEGDEEIGLLETPHDFKQSGMHHRPSESNTKHAGSTDQVELFVGGNECLLIPQKYLKSIGSKASEIVYAQNQDSIIYLTSRAIGSDSVCTRILKSRNLSLSQDHFGALGFKVHPGSSFFLAEIDQGLTLTPSD